MVPRTRPEGGGVSGLAAEHSLPPTAPETRDRSCQKEKSSPEGGTPGVFVSADSKEVTGEFLVSADSKGVISPLFPADPRGACKCGL